MFFIIALTVILIQVQFSHCIGEISKQKCEEYSRQVYFEQPSPLLLPRSGLNKVSECGIVEVPLIVGGTQAKLKEFPHMALIGFGIDLDSEIVWQCGGSLISEEFILTAAHCLNSRDKGPAQRVRLGIINLQILDHLQELFVSARISHPEYNPPLKYNDIGLLKLVEEVNFTPFVRPACLNFNPTSIQNTTAIATGFGKLSYESSDGSQDLMKVQLHIVPMVQCNLNFKSSSYRLSMPNGVTNSMVCAGERIGGKDTCQGDSGGPLQTVLETPYCMYSVIGVTSFGKFCGFANSPGIYSNVYDFLEWIEDVVWK